MVQAVGGELLEANNDAGAFQVLSEFLATLEKGSMVYNPDPFLDVYFSERYDGLRPVRSAATAGPTWVDTCERAAVGLAGVDSAFAQTGTVVVSSGKHRSRMVTLLPPVHLAIVRSAQIRADIIDWVVDGFKAQEANTVLVSGPSKTADIEQTLAVGVHGPKRFVVLLIGTDST